VGSHPAHHGAGGLSFETLNESCRLEKGEPVSIITISRGSYSHGKDVAEKVAQRLGYDLLAREVLLEASDQFNIPEAKLLMSMEDAPSLLDRFTNWRERYIAYIQAAILMHIQKDNVVYHGMAGHFFVKGVPHVLKVRIIADMDDRVKVVMKRDGLSPKEALRMIKRLDEERSKWSRQLYGIETGDPSLYDLVLHIKKLSINDAVDIICHTVNLKHFQSTPESQMVMDDLVLAARVKAIIVDIKSDAVVGIDDGMVTIWLEARSIQEVEQIEDIENIVRQIPGVKELKIEVRPSLSFGD
jgi:cytidylate kinase